jgi:hypothetical protein
MAALAAVPDQAPDAPKDDKARHNANVRRSALARKRAVDQLIAKHPKDFADLHKIEKRKLGIKDREDQARERDEAQLAKLAKQLGVKVVKA